MKRHEFEALVERVVGTTVDMCRGIDGKDAVSAARFAAMNAWDAQAADLQEARAKLEEREADMHARIRAGYDRTVADAWRAKVADVEAERDAQAAEVARLTAGVARLRGKLDMRVAEVAQLRAALLVKQEPTGVPLTAENAPRARVVETTDGKVLRVAGWESRIMDTLIHDGATVLAWSK